MKPVKRQGMGYVLLFGASLAPLAVRAANVTSETLATVVADVLPGQPTYVAVPVSPPPAAGGGLTAVGGTTIGAAGDDWSGLATHASGPWLVEITSGPRTGWWSRILSFDFVHRSAVLATSVPDDVLVGHEYRIRRIWTVGDLFTGANLAAFASGASPSVADRLILVDPDTHAQTTLFYSDTAGHTGWHDVAFAPADGVPVPPGLAVILERRSVGTPQVSFSGAIRSSNLTLALGPGVSVLGAQTPGDPVTLAASGLVEAGFRGGTTPAEADLVILPQADGTVRSYYYATTAADSGWKSTDGSSAPDAVLPANGAYLLQLKGSSPVEWRAPHSP